MSGGGKGTTTSKVEIPAWLEDAAKNNLAKADELAKIGYTPYYGTDVAAFTPMQEAAMANTGQAAAAFGMSAPSNPMAGMPEMITNPDGSRGYSSGTLYDQALAELKRRQPGQFAALQKPFINPVTGADPVAPFGNGTAPGAPVTPGNPGNPAPVGPGAPGAINPQNPIDLTRRPIIDWASIGSNR